LILTGQLTEFGAGGVTASFAMPRANRSRMSGVTVEEAQTIEAQASTGASTRARPASASRLSLVLSGRGDQSALYSVQQYVNAWPAFRVQVRCVARLRRSSAGYLLRTRSRQWMKRGRKAKTLIDPVNDGHLPHSRAGS
jgi:hypothetical protein